MQPHRVLQPWRHPLLGRMASRIVMSAMTRNSAGHDHSSTREMAEYYARRARGGVGLVLTESTIVHSSGDGLRNSPHLQTMAQADSWRQVIDAVHEAGTPIFCQLLHCGRIADPTCLGGAQPVSATSRRAEGLNRHTGLPYPEPRRLSPAEIPGVIDLFREAGHRALEVGFDGVQAHLAHGYLADQFFDARVNDRDDEYGGSVANRCRFGLEVTRALLAECGEGHVMVRISPAREMNGPYDWPDLDAMLAYLIPAFDAAGLRMLDVSCARADYYQTAGRVVRAVRPRWPHLLMGGASLSLDQAEAELNAGLLDLVTYGRLLIANPDLVEKFRRGEAPTAYDARMLEQLV